MDSKKVIITKQNTMLRQYSFENDVGLSTYDLALISIGKIIKKRELSLNEASKITFLI